ncbi:MAG: hypothetical protein IT447_05920 [Phycisphaerales bacterium]|jgi:hypothetical protein|nr:hypothetical protein [Phycisphaerales bacterium]
MSAWASISGNELRQGDVLDRCRVPILGPGYGISDVVEDLPTAQVRLLILTQSCDLAIQPKLTKPKAHSVALCRVYTLDEFGVVRSDFAKADIREKARQGRIEGVHLLPSPTDPKDNQSVLIAHFREVFSLPFAYLQAHTTMLPQRPRLQSPYLEHLAQGFARFFMRVGLPLDIPPYK